VVVVAIATNPYKLQERGLDKTIPRSFSFLPQLCSEKHRFAGVNSLHLTFALPRPLGERAGVRGASIF
jgi:hypothetical protein